MRTHSYISAIALAAALIATPQVAQAQSLGIDLGGAEVSVDLGGDSLVDVDAGVDLGGDNQIDAGVDVGGDSLVDVDAGVDVGGESGLGVAAGVELGGSGSGSGSNLVDVDVGVGAGSNRGSGGNVVDVDLGVGTGGGGGRGPNGGALIDLDANVLDQAVVDAEVGVGGAPTAPATSTPGGNNLITGNVRIGAIGGQDQRANALLDLIGNPSLADIDLDAAIDDRRVSIIAAADLLGSDALADIELAIETGGDGRTELLEAITGSNELTSIVGSRGIDLEDVVAVQIAENGATEVIVLQGVARVALGGEEGDLATVGLGDTAELDIDLLSDEELAEVDLTLLPEGERAQAQLRLLRGGGDLADLSVDQLANIDLDLLSDDELASLELDLLPEALRAPIQLRLLGEDGDLADLSVGELAQIDVNLQPGTPGTGGGGTDPDDGGTDPDDGADGGTDPDDGAGGGTDPDDGAGGGTDADNGTGGGDDDSNGGGNSDGNAPGEGSGGSGNSGGTGGGSDGSTTAGGNQAGVSASASSRVNSLVATLDCDIGVLALAKGVPATADTIASAKSLELVSIEGCERSLVDAEIGSIQQAIESNPAIAAALEEADVPADQIVGATVQAGILTLFIGAVTS